MDRKLQKYNWPIFLFWPILKEMLLQAFGNLITLCLQMPSQVTFIHASQNKLPERPHLPFFSRSLCPSVSHMSIYVFIWPLASLSRGVSILIEVKGHEAQRQNFHFPALCLIAALSFNLPLWFFLPSSIILFIFFFYQSLHFCPHHQQQQPQPWTMMHCACRAPPNLSHLLLIR